MDRARRKPYGKHAVARSAMGTAGARGVDATDIELTLAARRTGIPRWPIVNVDGSQVLTADEFLLGAHLDIYHPEVAALALMAAGHLQGHPDGLRPRPVDPLDAGRGGRA
ncbi:MAG: hypothetical protein ACE5JD_15355 [Candidatus Methylomirabilia bacterium]